MYDFEIKEKFKDCAHFMGVFPRDLLPKKLFKAPAGLILNTDKSNSRGEHWVSIVILPSKKGEYFDSFGLPPYHQEVLEFLNTNCENGWCFSPIPLQHPSSTSCGQYCTAFLKNRFNNISYLQFIKSFSINLKRNEKILKEGLKNVWVHIR